MNFFKKLGMSVVALLLGVAIMFLVPIAFV